MQIPDQPIGFPVPGWSPPPLPRREPIEGRYCRLEPLDADRHATGLFEAYGADTDERSWTYLAYGPFRNFVGFREWIEASSRGDDPLCYAVILQADGQPVGVVSYLRMTPAAGSIEVGHIHYGRAPEDSGGD